MLAKSHYLTLGIPQNESAGGIRRAFREHVKRYYPDRVGSLRVARARSARKGAALRGRRPSLRRSGSCLAWANAGAQGIFPCDLCDGEGLREEEESVRVTLPPNVGDGTLIEAPLRGLGPHHFYLCVCVRVAS